MGASVTSNTYNEEHGAAMANRGVLLAIYDTLVAAQTHRVVDQVELQSAFENLQNANLVIDVIENRSFIAANNGYMRVRFNRYHCIYIVSFYFLGAL
jgi:hypothetical protein